MKHSINDRFHTGGDEGDLSMTRKCVWKLCSSVKQKVPKMMCAFMRFWVPFYWQFHRLLCVLIKFKWDSSLWTSHHSFYGISFFSFLCFDLRMRKSTVTHLSRQWQGFPNVKDLNQQRWNSNWIPARPSCYKPNHIYCGVPGSPWFS